MGPQSMRDDPMVIGASGGSGTRVVARIVRHVGVFMGSSLNRSEDSQPFVDFYDAWTPLYLKREGRLSEQEERVVDASFSRALEQHVASLPHPGAPWGLKNPRSMLFLPLWSQRYPRMKFIHVIRSGLDMAYSDNQWEFQMYRQLVLKPEERRGSRRARVIAYWCRVNRVAAEFGERYLKERYFRVRFEDLCDAPARVVSQIFQFLGASERPRLDAAVADVASPRTIGRWRTRSPEEIHEIMQMGRSGLESFGYWDEAVWQAIDRAMHAPRWNRLMFKQLHWKRLVRPGASNRMNGQKHAVDRAQVELAGRMS